MACVLNWSFAIISCSAETDIESRDALAVVRSNGGIAWYPHCIFRSHCAIDVNNFPFDQQICSMAFGSWAYTSNKVDLQVKQYTMCIKCHC